MVIIIFSHKRLGRVIWYTEIVRSYVSRQLPVLWTFVVWEHKTSLIARNKRLWLNIIITIVIKNYRVKLLFLLFNFLASFRTILFIKCDNRILFKHILDIVPHWFIKGIIFSHKRLGSYMIHGNSQIIRVKAVTRSLDVCGLVT
jgi:hypothetical protein